MVRKATRLPETQRTIEDIIESRSRPNAHTSQSCDPSSVSLDTTRSIRKTNTRDTIAKPKPNMPSRDPARDFEALLANATHHDVPDATVLPPSSLDMTCIDPNVRLCRIACRVLKTIRVEPRGRLKIC